MSSLADQPAGDGHDPAVAARVEQLYTSHAALVRSVCRALLRDRLEAEDAVQQTFLSAQRALVNGTSPRDAAAWLATIARNACLARVRARMREPLPIELEEGDATPDAHTAAVRRHEAGELRDALAELPAHQREAILLREVRGLSYQEVASSLAVTTSAVESLLFRARRTLRIRLRGALTALTPGCLQTLRELAQRIGSGDVAAPAAVKVGAVGIGAALFAGGALGPTVIGLGHAPHSGRYASRPPTHRIVDAAPPEAPVSLRHASAGAQLRGGDRQTMSRTPKVFQVVGSPDRHEREGSTGYGANQDDRSDRTASLNGRSGSDDGSSRTDEGGSDDSRSSTDSTDTTTDTTTTDTTTTDDSTTTYPTTTND